MSKLQLTLPGLRLDENTHQSSSDSIRIDLDNQDGLFGKAISLPLYLDMIKRYSVNPDLRGDEKIYFIIDKQLLHILLASTRCNSLALCKCIRQDGQESIAFTALDKDGKILGTTINPISHEITLTDANSDISAGEWIQGLTREEAISQGIIATNPIGEGFFDFGRYLLSLKDKAEKLNPDK